MRSPLLVGGACLTVLLIFAVSSGAQPPQDAAKTTSQIHREGDVARWFAPILWPAIHETIWPTIPHPFAFDGRDNDGDRLFDLDDPDEVRFGMEGTSVPDLIDAFWDAKWKTRPPRRVVYSGPRAFDTTGTDVLEYWFYYLWDQGPGSHRHDAEHAFVFLDVKSSNRPEGDLSRYDADVEADSYLSDAVRMVVAAAHEGSTANNIIAATRQPHDDARVVPRQLPSHMPLLAELGKHATAPDLQLDGRFDPGLDANLFRGSIWGLRDSLTAGLGEVGFMNFEPWQSFPRQGAPISVERSFFASSDEGFLRTYRPYLDRYTLFKKDNTYSLFPMQDMEHLYELLASNRPDDEIRPEVITFLKDHSECFWAGEQGEWSGNISQPAFDLMRQWARKPPKHIRLWEHSDHREPKKVFKLHLFPRFALGAAFTKDIGYKDSVKRVVIEISDIKWPAASGWGGIKDFLFPGRLLTDSRLEISIFGTERSWAYQYDSVTWKKGRGNRSGVYLGLQRRKAELQDGELLSEEALADISFETGVPIDVLKKRRGGRIWPTGVRAGFFVGHSWDGTKHRFPSGRIELQVGIVVEPQKPISDVEAALGARPNIRFQLGTAVTWNTVFKRPEPWKH